MIVIFPHWSKETEVEKILSVVQAILALVVFGIILQSYKYNIYAIKYALYLQSAVFILSNFNLYKKDKTLNYQGLNILNAVFSMIFTVMNVVYATMINVN